MSQLIAKNPMTMTEIWDRGYTEPTEEDFAYHRAEHIAFLCRCIRDNGLEDGGPESAAQYERRAQHPANRRVLALAKRIRPNEDLLSDLQGLRVALSEASRAVLGTPVFAGRYRLVDQMCGRLFQELSD